MKKAMRRNSRRAHEKATKIRDGKQEAMKQVKKPLKEDVNHGHHRPCLTSLFEFFPKGYFGQENKMDSSFMLTSHQTIAIGELSAQEETNLVVHMVKGLPTWPSLSETTQLPEEDPNALVFKYVPKARKRKAYKLMANIGYDYGNPPSLGKLNLEVTETIDEQSKQPSPQRLVLEHIEPLGARASVFDRIGTSTQENDGLSSRSFVFQRIQRDGLPKKEYSIVSGRLSSPKPQDDHHDSGLCPSVFHRLREFKDYESKPKGSSQKFVFERIGDRNIKAWQRA
ncbi:hypothetical protein ACH5RR_006841 [Cinchona calisaya]|uniref:Uncharacterized protein n=1 Tax=Cinchona calisaya TaxID=153742 RepID=A0ABD3AQ78_9GENT